jgi:LPXTG-motif cell wall-anchored protein
LVNGAVDTTNVYKDSNGNIVCHAESDDINQTGCIVKIGTTATDSTTNSHVGTVGTSVSLKDVIAYNGVNTKTYYRIYTKLVTSDGKDLTDGEGNLFENTQYVTTTGYSGTVTVTMNIDTSKLAGKTVVFFEYIYEGDTLIAEHTSLTDELQTIYFPKITTVAAFTGTNSKTSLEGSNVSLTDTVSYENLIVGQSYTLSGKLMDKSTGKALLVNGKEVTATATLTPKETSGTATVVFNFDATGLTGKTVVVYQDVLVGSSIVYSEADINNTDQSVSFAKPIVLPNTGSRTGLIVNTLAVLLIGIGLFLCRRKKVQ